MSILHIFSQKSFLNKPLSTQGFSLLEIIVASGMLSMFLVSISFHYKKTLEVGQYSTRSIQSSFLLEEGIEAVKSLRDESWSGKINNLTVGTPYYLSWNGTKWTSTLTPQLIENTFTRTFTLASTTRDVNYDIVTSGGTNDVDARKVTVRVSWVRKNSTVTTTDIVEGYIMNLFNN